MGTKPPLKNGNGAKNMKVNGSHHNVSPTLRRDIRSVKVFSVNHLRKILAVCYQKGNTARLSPDHALSPECSAYESLCAWSYISVLDLWKYLLHFYFNTK